MKAVKIVFILSITCGWLSSAAQGIENPEEIKSLFSKENEIKGFGGVDINITDVYQFRSETGTMFNIEGGYGGLYLGGILFPNEVVHLTIPVLFGAGAFHIVDKQYFPTSFDKEYVLESTAFFVVKPSAQLEVNITQFLRVGVGATYRLIKGSDLRNISDDDLTSWGGTFSIRLGRF